MNFTTDHQQQYPRQPTTGFLLIGTQQAGLSSYALKLRFVGKVRKILGYCCGWSVVKIIVYYQWRRVVFFLDGAGKKIPCTKTFCFNKEFVIQLH